ncbi:alpha-N-acetylgalactosaminide alpha-2,6-sialyltransferase 2 isoform X1 [Hypomesus transpacificus]|uniref:alpha-N-acetylgalactosaminide alpha-2,6-sialyltransferase 2 isoform X1 n=1 Tax=Hypomesus transpacificus TaxID=137520 RepID=UPI001F074AE4|nr:alpha-N-acetylgalactosaminide alpha-2,6-sialyltransferase 2 isoform X1 [Hypomesus transpacificus]
MKCSRKVVFLVAALCVTITTIIYSQFGFNATPQRSPEGRTDTIWNFKEEQWNLSTNTREELQVEATCSLREAARQGHFLGQRFNFSVPVFQWAGSFQKRSWRRLSKRVPPYGWKGLEVGVLRAALTQLREPSCGRLLQRGAGDQCVRCAVVGNGGILRGSGQGGAIDAHDYVFRMNGAITKGFEEDVGTKTSFYGFTTNTMKNSLISYRHDGFTRVPQGEGVRYIFIPSDRRDYVMLAAAIQGQTVRSGYDRGNWTPIYFGPNPSAQKFKILHPDFISYVTQRFLDSHQLKSKLYMPSTGALMLMTALHTCDQVSAYGFITRNYKDFSEHYYNAVWKPLRFFANHDLQMESWLWESMDHRKIMTLYRRRVNKQ